MKSQSVLAQQFDSLAIYAATANSKNPSVSGWSVHQHVEHVLLANAGIIGMIEKASPPAEIKSRSLISYFALTFGYIPRGRAKSPAEVAPQGVSAEQLQSLLNETRTRYQKLDIESRISETTPVGNHPYFGSLTSSEWLRFMEVHTKHHLKIIADITSQGSSCCE